jgi:hypothetical protein
LLPLCEFSELLLLEVLSFEDGSGLGVGVGFGVGSGLGVGVGVGVGVLSAF